MNRLLKFVFLSVCSAAAVSCSSAPEPGPEAEVVDPHNKWGFVDQTGKVVIEPRYERVLPFSEGLAAVVIGKYWGYLDKTGKIAIKPTFDVATPFADGLAAVNVKGKWGYIDSTGTLVIEPKYDNARPFCEDYAGVKLDNRWSFIDKKGKEIAGNFMDVGSFGKDLGAFRGETLWGYIDTNGKEVIPQKFSSAGTHNSDGIAEVTTPDGRFGLIDRNGIITYQNAAEKPSLFSDGLSTIDVKGQWGFADKTGKVVIPAKFSSVDKFSQGVALVRTKGGYYGFVDTKGKMLIEPTFPNAQSFSEGFAPVRVKDGKWGFIDQKGKLVIDPKYAQAEQFKETLAAVKVD